MLDIFGLAFLFTVATLGVGTVVAFIIVSVNYVIDYWDEFSGLFKALGIILLIYVAWVVAVWGYKINKQVNPVKAEVEDVLASE